MKRLAIIAIALAAVTSCQKVIDVDLNEANAQSVIEANYTAEDSTVLVRVTSTSSYFNSDPSTTIDNATVTITDATGTSTNVPFVGSGEYILENYAPQFDTEYTLTVVANGTSHEAKCNMLTPVLLEDITYQFFPSFFGSDPGYAPFLNYFDPAGVANFHFVLLGKNGQEWNELPDFIGHDDLLVDGNFVERPIFGRELYELGDTIHMNFLTVDERILTYYGQAASNAGGGGSSAPGNPDSNWDNGALGYFSAYSNSRKSIVVQ